MPRLDVQLSLFAASVAVCAALVFGRAAEPSRFAPDDSRLLTLLVFPFENESHIANLDWLGEGLSELTLERLEDRGMMVLSRQDRLATLEKIGLPDSARFSHATLVKIAVEADADVVVYGRFISDGKTATLEARVLHISPPSLSPALTESGSMQDLLRTHARLSWRILCAMDQKNCLAEGANRDESSFSDPPPTLRLDAFENFVRAVTGSNDETRLRLLREASRLEPAWDRPAFALGQTYFERRDCESALPWLSRVPPNRPVGADASFDTGVCHLQRNDPARAEAAFSGLLERAHSADLKERLPEFPEARNNLGVARLRLGKYFEAGVEFDRAAALDPDEPDYWLNLGIAKLAGKQPAAAVAPLEYARKLNPDERDTRLLLIATLESLGRGSDAAAIRAELSQSGAHSTPSNSPASKIGETPNLQDPAALSKLARVSKELDRTSLRTSGETPADGNPSGPSPRKRPSKRGSR